MTIIKVNNGILEVDGLLARGINIIHTEDDFPQASAGFGIGWNTWDSQKVLGLLGWLRQSGINFIRCHVTAGGCWSPELGHLTVDQQTYLSRLAEIAGLCDIVGIGIEFDFYCFGFKHDDDHPGQPFPPFNTNWHEFNTVDDFTGAVYQLAVVLASYKNACIGIWNEPDFKGSDWQAKYDNYFTYLPWALAAARAAGFVGPIAVMGSLAFIPDRGGGPEYGNDNMDWALKHLWLFSEFGEVFADIHIYYQYTSRQNFPDSIADIEEAFMVRGMIRKAQGLGVAVGLHEIGGTLLNTSIAAAANAATQNALIVCERNNVSWAVFSLTDYVTDPPSSSFEYVANQMKWNTWGQQTFAKVIDVVPPVEPPIVPPVVPPVQEPVMVRYCLVLAVVQGLGFGFSVLPHLRSFRDKCLPSFITGKYYDFSRLVLR